MQTHLDAIANLHQGTTNAELMSHKHKVQKDVSQLGRIPRPDLYKAEATSFCRLAFRECKGVQRARPKVTEKWRAARGCICKAEQYLHWVIATAPYAAGVVSGRRSSKSGVKGGTIKRHTGSRTIE